MITEDKMGEYFNPENDRFTKTINSEIYLDKSGLITYLNSVIQTEQEYICVSRPRRFGKSITAAMLAAYYSSGCDSREIFRNLQITKDPQFNTHLNQYNVIFINIQDFLSQSSDIDEMLDLIINDISEEMLSSYPQLTGQRFLRLLQRIYSIDRKPFIFIIDEWDCVLRVYQKDSAAQNKYLDFLRLILKDKAYVGLAYMTGILPIKKYGTHSALNMFDEFSMTNPRQFAQYVGFTQEEVQSLCNRYQMDYLELSAWYNGYRFKNVPAVYSPKSVISAVLSGVFSDYWNQTETYEALKIYIIMNYQGLKDDIIKLLAEDKIIIDIGGFTNDMVTFSTADDVLTLLIHLGYLRYDMDTSAVSIPNKEIASEFVTAIRSAGWSEVINAVNASNELLNATWREDNEAVAGSIQSAHLNTSILTYNNENALSYTISLAYYSAREYYTTVREMPAGKGFADLVFLPRRNHMDKPAMVVELKWDQTAAGAIQQIKDKQYVDALKDYGGNILLIGIVYDKETKQHECNIEKLRYA